MDHPKEDHNKREFKPQIMDEILDLPKNTATEYVIKYFWYICPDFSFILQIIKSSQGIKIIQTRNFTIFILYATIFGQFMVAFYFS